MDVNSRYARYLTDTLERRMPRSDQSQTAILGALSIMPMTGYTLREQIRDTLGHFWSESFGQIYPTLAELERQALVEREQADGSRSTTYRITQAGSEQLRRLLAQPPQEPKPRNGLLLRLFFGAQLGPDKSADLVIQARESAERRLAELNAARAELLEDSRLAADAPYVLLTISAGEHAARATIDWADEALGELSRIPQ
jgi:DNA-binding PadR family transcriptional regulator